MKYSKLGPLFESNPVLNFSTALSLTCLLTHLRSRHRTAVFILRISYIHRCILFISLVGCTGFYLGVSDSKGAECKSTPHFLDFYFYKKINPSAS